MNPFGLNLYDFYLNKMMMNHWFIYPINY